MPLARRADSELNVGVVPAPDSSLPADPGLEEMFSELYTRLVPVAVDHASRFLSESEARDAVADAFEEVWARWKKLTVEQRSAAYVLGAVHFHILQRLRENKPLVSLEDAEAELSHLATHEIDSPTRATTAGDVVDLVLAAMPHRRREVFLLVRELRYTYKEVAELLSISEGTVNTHMRLAGEDVRTALQNQGFRIAAGGAALLAPGAKEETDV